MVTGQRVSLASAGIFAAASSAACSPGAIGLSDHGQRVVELLAGFRAVIDRKFEHGLALARRGNDAAHVLGRKHRSGRHAERLLLRLAQADGHRLGVAFGMAVDRIGAAAR